MKSGLPSHLPRRGVCLAHVDEIRREISEDRMKSGSVADLSKGSNTDGREKCQRDSGIVVRIQHERPPHGGPSEPAMVADDLLQNFRSRGAAGGDFEDLGGCQVGVAEEIFDDERLRVEEEAVEDVSVLFAGEHPSLPDGDIVAVDRETYFR